jgi:hypothetical protein
LHCNKPGERAEARQVRPDQVLAKIDAELSGSVWTNQCFARQGSPVICWVGMCESSWKVRYSLRPSMVRCFQVANSALSLAGAVLFLANGYLAFLPRIRKWQRNNLTSVRSAVYDLVACRLASSSLQCSARGIIAQDSGSCRSQRLLLRRCLGLLGSISWADVEGLEWVRKLENASVHSYCNLVFELRRC